MDKQVNVLINLYARTPVLAIDALLSMPMQKEAL
jgi:hypothetical protein